MITLTVVIRLDIVSKIKIFEHHKPLLTQSCSKSFIKSSTERFTYFNWLLFSLLCYLCFSHGPIRISHSTTTCSFLFIYFHNFFYRDDKTKVLLLITGNRSRLAGQKTKRPNRRVFSFSKLIFRASFNNIILR